MQLRLSLQFVLVELQSCTHKVQWKHVSGSVTCITKYPSSVSRRGILVHVAVLSKVGWQTYKTENVKDQQADYISHSAQNIYTELQKKPNSFFMPYWS